MNIAIPKEIAAGERRVALIPESVKRLVTNEISVLVESGAGSAAGYPDDAYTQAGATIVSGPSGLWARADVVLKIHMPQAHPTGKHELEWYGEGKIVIGNLQPMVNPDGVRRLAERKVTSLSLDMLPRITRAQSMDVLSSQSTVAGYKAVLLAAAELGKFFPMLVTAAGTIAPSKVLVLGAGVAGLQAIATARRLGAVVSAFDVRPAVKEQVESLGARFLEAPTDQAAEDVGGYAKELSEEQHRRELELIHAHIKEMDAVITTALIPGRPAPELITEAMVRDMRPGSVIVDLAAEMGGNCALTQKGETVEAHGVTIMGRLNLPSTMPTHASQMYSKNITTFLQHLLEDGSLKLDFEDEITAATCITRDGQIVHAHARAMAEGGSGT